jgi:hypothetical protein
MRGVGEWVVGMEYCRLPGCQALLIGQMTVYDGRESDEGGARQYLDPKNGDGDGETAVLLRFPTGLMSGLGGVRGGLPRLPDNFG